MSDLRKRCIIKHHTDERIKYLLRYLHIFSNSGDGTEISTAAGVIYGNGMFSACREAYILNK